MNASTKRTVAGGVGFGAVAAIVLGVYAFAASPSTDPEPTQSPTPSISTEAVDVPPLPNPDAAERQAEDDRLTAERIAADEAAAAAAQAEADRLAAEQAAAEEAARQAAQSQQGESTDNTGNVSNPAPAPAPAPLKTCPGGTTATEYDGAGNAVACMDPACFTGEVAGDDPRCAVVRP